jgi:hypothetical protein
MQAERVWSHCAFFIGPPKEPVAILSFFCECNKSMMLQAELASELIQETFVIDLWTAHVKMVPQQIYWRDFF